MVLRLMAAIAKSIFLFNFQVKTYSTMNHDIFPILISVWQVFAGISLALFILSFVLILVNKKLPNREKILWLLGALLLPILGPILFLTLGRHGK